MPIRFIEIGKDVPEEGLLDYLLDGIFNLELNSKEGTIEDLKDLEDVEVGGGLHIWIKRV